MSSFPRSLALRVAILAVLGAALGSLSFVAATRHLGPAPELFERDFHVARPADQPIEVSEARPLRLPYPFADFVLTADVEVPAGGTLDLLMRQVSPRRRASGDMPLFHARFVALRMSADGRSGPALRTREQALFEPGFQSGHDLGAGRPAGIRVEARGRALRVNVAGVWHGPFEAADAHGSLTFIARGGVALVRSLRIDFEPRGLAVPPIGWCALGGLVVGLLVALLTRRRPAPVFSLLGLIALPACAWLIGGLVLAHELAETEPEPLALVLAALSGAPLAVAFALRRRVIGIVVGAVLVVAAWEGSVRLELPRLAPFEDSRLDAHFGALSGEAPVDALARTMHARVAVHTTASRGERVVFLGGEPLFEGGADIDSWAGPMAALFAGRILGRELEAVVAPTLYGYAQQQLRMFERYYAEAYAPRAVVFAIAPWEGESSERPDSRGVPDEPSASTLVELWRRVTAPRAPTTDAAGLAQTLRDLADLAGRRGFLLLVVDDPGLPLDLAAAVDEVVRERGLMRRSLALLDDPSGVIGPLSEALAELLER